jgi:radical SAM protein with 4Fe4S-binding SPASM domain
MQSKIYVEITNVCNLRCSFCPPTKRKGEFMSARDFELYLDKLVGHAEKLYFHLKGEPLLHPELGYFLDLAGQKGFAVFLTTNGALLGQKPGLLLGAKSLGKLSVSLHSHSGAEDVDAYWSGVEAFLNEHRKRPSFPVSLRLWNRSAGSLPPETERLWSLIRARYPRAAAWDSPLAHSDSTELDTRVFLNEAEEFAWPDLARPQGEAKGFCRGLRNQIGVLVDGSVVPCCMDGDGVMRLGNLRESSLAEILASPRARAIYEGFSRRELVEPLCRSCGYRRAFPSWA